MRAQEKLAKSFFSRKKKPVRYDIRLFDNRMYRVTLKTVIPASWIADVAKYLIQKSNMGEAEAMKEFEVDEKLHPKIVKRMKAQMKDIESQVSEDIPAFKMHTVKVEQFKYTKEGENYRLKIKLTGHFGA